MDPYTKVKTYKERSEHLLIGLMSGTSLDGIDAALVKIGTDSKGSIEKVSLEAFHYLPYSKKLREMLMSLCSVETAKLDRLVLANAGVSEWYAIAVQQLLNQAGMHAKDIDAICSHGQTVWHAPGPNTFPGPDQSLEIRSTLQLGDITVIAERTGIPVVGNFRSRDMAAGGEGAPLVPYLDGLLFKSEESGRILQNIGGIGNATVIPKGSLENVYAFDTGPGNILIDSLVEIVTNGKEHFDEDGNLSGQGTVCQDLLDEYLQDPYYERKPPKSIGREVYSSAFARQFYEKGRNKNLSDYDILATATALTAETIAKAYEDFIFPDVDIHEVILSGGGAYNRTLIEMIKKRLPKGVKVLKSDDFGIPSDAKEAVAFAVLGHETLMGRPSNLPRVTGAKRPVILGTVVW